MPKRILTPAHILCAALIAGILFCAYLIFDMCGRAPVFSEAKFVWEAVSHARA